MEFQETAHKTRYFRNMVRSVVQLQSIPIHFPNTVSNTGSVLGAHCLITGVVLNYFRHKTAYLPSSSVSGKFSQPGRSQPSGHQKDNNQDLQLRTRTYNVQQRRKRAKRSCHSMLGGHDLIFVDTTTTTTTEMTTLTTSKEFLVAGEWSSGIVPCTME